MDEKTPKSPEMKATTPRNKKNLILFFRWVIIVFVTLYFLFAYDSDMKSMSFFWVLFLLVLYNMAVTFLSMHHRSKSKNGSKLSTLCDILMIATLCYHLGGINSDLFILFVFILGNCGIYSSYSFTLTAGLFTIAAYSVSCILAQHEAMETLNYWRLASKDILLLMASYGVTLINHEVRKYGELHKKEFKLARTDKLTGLANRHYFDQKLTEEVAYVHESGMPLNILIFDLDNFKRFNDTYGHLWGDKLLTLFSDIIMQNIRKSDIPVRYGGEEFLILVRDLDANQAKSIGERIRRQLEKQRIYVGDEEHRKRVTVSCGVSQFPRDSVNVKDAIECADKALYHAKEIGKNIVVGYREIGHVQRMMPEVQDMPDER